MLKTTASRIVAAALFGIAGLTALPREANAIPTLQLGIVGGTYDSTTETVISTGPTFALYAFLQPDKSNILSDSYFLSMALTPQISTPANLGSFTYNSNTVNVTSDMTYGTPPIDLYSSSFDPGDLAKHGLFPTYFKEVAFQFKSGSKSAAFDTQSHPTWGPQSGAGMYYQLFDINTSNLASGYAVHFDLYNTQLCTNGKGQCAGKTDIDITQFAPFSHDAQSATSVTAVPEPETYAMMLAGLGLMGFIARRRRERDAD